MFDFGHPTDVNVYRNVIRNLEMHGHKTKVTARDKENTVKLLETYGLDYEFCPHNKGMLSKALGIPKINFFVYKVARKFSPDIFVSAGSPYAAQVSKVLGKPHIAFPNTEHAKFAYYLSMPFTDLICTPTFFKKDFGKKHKRFNGFNELAYLHPNYFKPDKDILKGLGLEDTKYILIRFSALDSHHDLSAKGFDFKNENEILDFIRKIEEFGRVVITSEIRMGSKFERYKLDVPPDKWHDFLYYATMYIGEGAKTASEGAILGVPSIYVSNTRRGYLDELEEKYDMAYTISNKDEVLNKAIPLLEKDNLKDIWRSKREKMLEDKIDTVEFMVNVITDTAKNKASHSIKDV